jgi:hypothetical protein
MDEAEFKYIIDCIKQAEASGETDTPLGRVLAKWGDIDIPVGDGKGRWLLEGFIMTFKRYREILNAIDPSVSPDVPPHLLDPVQIAHFFGIRLEDFNWQGPQSQAEVANALQRIEGKFDAHSEKTSDRLSKIQTDLTALVQQHTIKEFYTTEDLCKIFGKTPYTVREWCRLRRINAKKVPSSRGGEFEWRISHEEIVRIQNEGLLPVLAKY